MKPLHLVHQPQRDNRQNNQDDKEKQLPAEEVALDCAANEQVLFVVRGARNLGGPQKVAELHTKVAEADQ